MKGRDRAIVAVILAAALIGGLVLVHGALDRAARAQAASLAAAQYNGGEEGVSGEENLPTGDGSAQTGDSSQPQDGEETLAPEETPQEDSSSQDGSQPVQTGTEEAPSAGGGAMTLAELTAWMQNESSGALAAQSMLEAEQALAAGAGTAADALRRTFAQSQAQMNYEARRNQLSEEAASLGYEYLKCRDLLALQEEGAAFWQALEEAIAAQAQEGEGDAAREERRQADLVAVQEQRTAQNLALEEAKANLEAATEALNAALGNPYGTDITVTDTLTAEAMPTISGDGAAAQALELRSERKAAQYRIEREEQTLTQLRYQYAPTSPEVLEQQAAVQEAKAAAAQTETQVEADVRDRLARLELQAQKLEQRSAALEETGTEPPEADYVLEGGTEEGAWSSNLSALTEEWTAIRDNRAALIEELAQFNLDVLCFQHAIGVGCTAVEI